MIGKIEKNGQDNDSRKHITLIIKLSLLISLWLYIFKACFHLIGYTRFNNKNIFKRAMQNKQGYVMQSSF